MPHFKGTRCQKHCKRYWDLILQALVSMMVVFRRFLQMPDKRPNSWWTSSSLYLISVNFKLGHWKVSASWHFIDILFGFSILFLFLEPSGSLQYCRVSFSKLGELFRKHPSIWKSSLRSHPSNNKVLRLENVGKVSPDSPWSIDCNTVTK